MSSFGGAYGKTTGDYVNAAKDAIVTMITALPEITIKDEEDEFVSKEFKEEYEKIYRDVVKYTTPIIKALNGLPVMMILLLFLQKQNLAFAVYLFGLVLSLPD